MDTRIRSLVKGLVLSFLIASLMATFALADNFPFVHYTKQMISLKNDASANAATTVEVPSGSAIVISGEQGDFYIALYEGKSGYVLKASLTEDANQAAPQQTAIPASESTLAKYSLLKEGDSGLSVTALQEGLVELGFLKGKADGKYGPKTTAAVEAFQTINKLPTNGIADAEMQRLLFETEVKNSKGKNAKVKVVGTDVDITLRPGNYGEAVKTLQARLKELEYYKGTVDGKYGKNTENAVKAFQKANNLKSDGKAGPKTLTLLYSAGVLQAGATQNPNPTASNTASTTNTADTAQTGEPLPTAAPATYPYTTTTISSVNIRSRTSTSSTRLGTVPKGATVEVIRTSGNYLYISYGKTKGYVLSQYVNIPEQYLPGKSFATDLTARQKYETLAEGSTGEKVQALQEALKELGFFRNNANSNYDSATIEAVRLFQQKNGYKQTGIALPELQQLLYEGRPKNSNNRSTKVMTLAPIENPDMSLGVKGEKVRWLQNALKSLGYYKNNITGTYDSATQNAVKAYQKAHSIKQTGKMDSFTWLSINTVMAKIENPSQDTNQGLNEGNVVVMRKGTRGSEVSRLQTRLVSLGYLTSAIDGIYGDSTISAVKEFQSTNSIATTGEADLNTQIRLYSSDAVAKANAVPHDWQALNEEDTKNNTDVSTNLKIGSSGDAVKALQTRLIDLKYLTGTADGIYGTATAKAVAAFQKANGLTADGIAGQNTQSAIYASSSTPNNQNTGDTNQNAAARMLKLGMTGEDVKTLQKRLSELKYYTGAQDGIMGPNTVLSLTNFQKKNSLVADGVLGALTKAKLNSTSAIAAGGLPLVTEQAPIQNPSANNTENTQSFTAPKASEVIFAPWTEIRSAVRQMPNVIIYDFQTGTHYNVSIFSLGKHADGEPITKEDTRKMFSALGEHNWTPRPVWVILSDGRVYMASTHSRGHELDKNPNNGLNGHICVHFPRTMEDAAATGPYAVSHQNAILAGWDLTKEMAK